MYFHLLGKVSAVIAKFIIFCKEGASTYRVSLMRKLGIQSSALLDSKDIIHRRQSMGMSYIITSTKEYLNVEFTNKNLVSCVIVIYGDIFEKYVLIY